MNINLYKKKGTFEQKWLEIVSVYIWLQTNCAPWKVSYGFRAPPWDKCEKRFCDIRYTKTTTFYHLSCPLSHEFTLLTLGLWLCVEDKKKRRKRWSHKVSNLETLPRISNLGPCICKILQYRSGTIKMFFCLRGRPQIFLSAQIRFHNLRVYIVWYIGRNTMRQRPHQDSF